jgi:hypothetical protein
MAGPDVPPRGFEIQRDLEIGRDVATVFAFLTDPTKFRTIDHALVEVEPTTPMALGMSGRMTHRRGGMTARTTWSVTRFEPPTELVVEIRGSGYAMTESAELTAMPERTRIRFVDRVWPTSLPGRLLVALSGGIMRRDLEARANRLRRILETGDT